MKINKRRFNIKRFVDKNVVELLEKEGKWDFYEENLLDYIEDNKDRNPYIVYPFIINSFRWDKTPQKKDYWIEISRKIDWSLPNKLCLLKDVLKEIGYENY